jgi:hypothetical protein
LITAVIFDAFVFVKYAALPVVPVWIPLTVDPVPLVVASITFATDPELEMVNDDAFPVPAFDTIIVVAVFALLTFDATIAAPNPCVFPVKAVPVPVALVTSKKPPLPDPVFPPYTPILAAVPFVLLVTTNAAEAEFVFATLIPLPVPDVVTSSTFDAFVASDSAIAAALPLVFALLA